MQFKKIISLVIVAATLFSLVSASLPVTAITADEMQYVRFSAMRHRNLSVTYSVNGKTGTFEDSWGYLGFIGRAVDQSGKVLNSPGVYSFGICTEGEKIGSGGPENSTMRDGAVQSGASEAYVYVPSKQIFDFTYTDENKSLPADWVFKCFYYANQIALERGINIAELEKGYWEIDAELRELKKYNENKKNGTLSDKDILIDLSYCVQIAAKMIPDFMFETDENGVPVKFNYDLQIISATSDRGHRFKSEYRENDADVRDVMENCAEIIKRAIEDKDGISDKLFRIDEKGAWAVTNPDGQTVSRLTFYHTFNPSYRGTYQRMGVFTTDYHTADSPENRGKIEIYKTDTNGNPLQGAEFTVYDIYGNIPATLPNNGKLITDSNGYAATELKALDFGIYTIVETKFPDGYTKLDGAPTSWRVTLSADTPNGVVTVNAVNDTKKTSVSGVKLWNDADDRDGIRPDSITVRLYADGVEIASKTVTENDGWAYTFEDLPIMEAGKRIEYTVLEDSVPGYTPTVNGFDITNTHTPEVITVSGVKTWDDDSDRDGVRPDSITVRLYADGVEVAEKSVTSADGWSFAFANVPKYKDGKLITYTVSEDNVDGYTSEVNGFDITNTHAPEVITVSGVKTWADNENQDGIRPDSITVRLYADGVEVAEKSVTSADGWRYSFANLPKYKDGKLITYTVSEDNVDGYTTSVNGFDITNIHTPEVITVSGVKTWADNDDQDGIRPDSITVRLYADGVEVSHVAVRSSDDWRYSFANLPKYKDGKLITYTVSEDNVDGYTTSVNGFNITNTHTPEVITVSGVKTWADNDDQDGIRPDSITVRLYADGVEVSHVAVTSADNWRYLFANLPKYKGGKLITYTVSEDNVDGYTTSVNGFNITNTHTPDVITVSGVKTWDDNENQDGIRPDSITVRLYADGVEVAHVAVTSADGWSFAFANMPKYKNGAMISYTITEDSVDGYETVIDSFVITNTHTPDTLTVSGTKTWADNDDQDGIRPDSITVRLYADGVEVAHVAVTSADNWRYSFANLPKYKGGALIVYTVSEDDIEGYTSEVNGFDITNTHTPDVITVSGVKTWDDDNDRDGVRPDSITVRLYADGVEVSHVVVRSSDDWKYTFENLPKHSDGKLITYTISEDIVLGYTSEVNGFDITNTHIPVPNDNEPDIENPDTFDRFGVMILTLAASALGIAAVIRKKARC